MRHKLSDDESETEREKERDRASAIRRVINSNCNYIEARVLFLGNWQANALFAS